jgi:hypothetical protein
MFLAFLVLLRTSGHCRVVLVTFSLRLFMILLIEQRTRLVGLRSVALLRKRSTHDLDMTMLLSFYLHEPVC